MEAGVDALAVETIPCQMEAEAVVDLLCEEFPETKFWVSFQCKVVRGSCIIIYLYLAFYAFGCGSLSIAPIMHIFPKSSCFHDFYCLLDFTFRMVAV